jgi:hypothetical protein
MHAEEGLDMTTVLESGSEAVLESGPKSVHQAAKEGAASGARAAREMWSLLDRAVSGGAYGSAYYLAYGITFGAMLVGRLIPRDSPVAKGMHAGAEAAVASYQAWEIQRRDELLAAPGAEGGDTATLVHPENQIPREVGVEESTRA